MHVLVTGGGGYIGAHTVWLLVDYGYKVSVIDRKPMERALALPPGTRYVRGDMRDVRGLCAELDRVDAVMHFAANSLVGESVVQPRKYFEENLLAGLALLGWCVDRGVTRFVLSSTAAVYGEPQEVPIPESHPLTPTNPYGVTKVALESALQWYGQAYGLRSICLRYFNAAGAHESGRIGEDHEPETHLIPRVLRYALGLESSLTVFGTDYPTPDGTAIRDYVHVMDLAEAHLLGLKALDEGVLGAFNLGSQRGYSVMEVIAAAEAIIGRRLNPEYGPRRPGDPAILVADSERARRELGWQPQFEDLHSIVASAWKWHSRYLGKHMTGQRHCNCSFCY